MTQDELQVQRTLETTNIIIQREQYGMLPFTEHQEELYRAIINLIIDLMGGEAHISERGAGEIVQVFLMKSIFFNPSNGLPDLFKDRLRIGLNELRKWTDDSETLFQVYFPIFGINGPDRPYKFGICTFRLLNRQYCTRQLRLHLTGANEPSRNLELRRRFFGKMEGHPAVCLTIRAIDAEAANQRGLEIARSTIDVLNCIIATSIRVGSTHPLLQLLNDADSSNARAVVLGRGLSRFPLQSQRMPLHIPFLLMDKLSRRLIRNASAIARTLESDTESNGSMKSRLALAMQASGRALRSINWQETLLHSMIGLETLVCDKTHSEVTYRVKQRIAFLIGNSAESRSKIMSRVGKLYTTRSEIVHTGTTKGSREDADIALIYLNLAVQRILTDPQFRRMENLKDLMAWYDKKLMR